MQGSTAPGTTDRWVLWAAAGSTNDYTMTVRIAAAGAMAARLRLTRLRNGAELTTV